MDHCPAMCTPGVCDWLGKIVVCEMKCPTSSCRHDECDNETVASRATNRSSPFAFDAQLRDPFYLHSRCSYWRVFLHPFICIILYLAVLSTCSHAAAILPADETIISSKTVDGIYVIGLERCEERWNRVFQWANQHNLRINPVHGIHFETIDMHNPPIPITGAKKHEVIMAGQVACTTSHIRVWRDAFRKNLNRTIVLEDDVRMSESLLKRLPRLIASAENGSKRRQNKPWHYIYLRINPTKYVENREVWDQGLRIAPPGWGTAAYVLSRAGLRFLLTRVTAYSRPLDVQIERLQRGLDTEGADFVALDACGLDDEGYAPAGCPENIHELAAAERGNCMYSGTQSGNGVFGEQMPGTVKS